MATKDTPQAPRGIELLAPARDAATAMAAIDHGADAVYMGAPAFGARASAGNSLEDLQAVARYAHRFGARLYVTVNTIIYDSELQQAEKLIWDLWRIGADALIVQDLAVTRMNLPPIALHASTQCDTRTPEKARFLESCGFTRLVLARELTINEIRAIHEAVSADLEVFVHGALCVSFSGDCQASFALTGRSANRGECAQICRYKFDLEDGAGRKLIEGKHLLSLRDMNRLDKLGELLDAGASSLKIEGRLKDVAYVKDVVAAYRKKLDAIIAANPERYRRSSFGRSEVSFDPAPEKSFNRGFTDYFLTNRQPANGTLASFSTPKSIGLPVGRVVKCKGKTLWVKLKTPLNNGDGLGYFDTAGEFRGFRVNRVENDRLMAASEVTVPSGTVLYRNFDKEREMLLAGKTAVRRIGVALQLSKLENGLRLVLRSEDGAEVTVADYLELDEAKSPQAERRRKELEKLGDTIYEAAEVSDTVGNLFVPASRLSALRRRGIEMLDVARAAAFRPEKPGKASASPLLPEGYRVTRHDNIANHISAGLYAQAVRNGEKLPCTAEAAENLPRAAEVDGLGKDTRVMETRYCLRRELGCCLKTPQAGDLPRDLYLVSGSSRFRLAFDCANCRMQLHVQNRCMSEPNRSENCCDRQRDLLRRASAHTD